MENQNRNIDINTISSTFGAKVPPSSDEAERAVLGAMMLDSYAIANVLELIQPESFYNLRNKIIFEVITTMFERRLPVDLLTLSDELVKVGKLESLGGMNYLTEINRNSVSAENVEHHARIVQEKYLKRSLIKTSGQILAGCYDETTDVFEEIDKAEAEIFDIAEKRMSKSYIPLGKIASKVYKDLENLRKSGNRGVTGVRTGIFQLDKMTAGFQKSDMIIIAARPSMGKTALALSIARNMAVEYEEPVAFFSLEMASDSLAQRLISAEARVDLSKIRSGYINDSENGQIVNAISNLSNATLLIDDSAGIPVLEIRAKCRRLKAEHNIQAVFIDYIGIIASPPNVENRQREIAIISQQFKQIAKELEIPVIVLAQLNRMVEGRKDKIPMLSDLRESGSIEQDADVVILVHRREYYGEEIYKEDNMPTENTAELIIAKQRNGPTGTIKTAFIKNYARFENLDSREVPPEVQAQMNKDNQKQTHNNHSSNQLPTANKQSLDENYIPSNQDMNDDYPDF